MKIKTHFSPTHPRWSQASPIISDIKGLWGNRREMVLMGRRCLSPIISVSWWSVPVTGCRGPGYLIRTQLLRCTVCDTLWKMLAKAHIMDVLWGFVALPPIFPFCTRRVPEACSWISASIHHLPQLTKSLLEKGEWEEAKGPPHYSNSSQQHVVLRT